MAPPTHQDGKPVKPNDLRPISRFITDHNSEAKAVFSTQLADQVPTNTLPNDAVFRLAYTTTESPVNMQDGKDIDSYAPRLSNHPGIVIPGTHLAHLPSSPTTHSLTPFLPSFRPCAAHASMTD
jgi:hypothetical protein